MSVGSRRLARGKMNLTRQVFAHYFTPYPLSIDNAPAAVDYYQQGYLNPHGENNKHVAYGGFLRERPLPQTVSTSSTWQLDNYKTEVMRAYAAGLTGFSLDILGITNGSYNWERCKLVIQAVHELQIPFKVLLMPDGSADATLDATALRTAIVSLVNGPHGNALFRLSDGRLVVSPFAPELRGVAFWRDQFLPQMAAAGVPVAFVPCFLDYFANVASFDAFCYGFSFWGDRSPAGLPQISDRATDAHGRGKLFMSPVAFQDARPYTGGYQEACNTETLRGMWQKAIDTNSEWVQIITWNDYSENTQVSPSTHSGWGPLELCAYYAALFKSKSVSIATNTLYLSHRIQPYNATPVFSQTRLMQPYQYASSPRNTVEALTLLASPQQITVNIGDTTHTYTAPAGLSAQSFPLGFGSVGATMGSQTLISPFPITAKPYVQDMNYYMVSTSHNAPALLSSSYTDVANGGTPPTTIAHALTAGCTAHPTNNTYRSEVIWGTAGFPYFMLALGDSVVCEFTVTLNGGFATGVDDSWNVLWQLHGHTINSTNQWPGPPVALIYENGTFRIAGGAAVPTGNTITGQPAGSQAAMEMANQYSEASTRLAGIDGATYHWTIETLLGGPGTGKVNAWCNGQQIASEFTPAAGTFYTAPNGYQHAWLYIKNGLYGGVNPGMTAPASPRTVMFAGLHISHHTPGGGYTTYTI